MTKKDTAKADSDVLCQIWIACHGVGFLIFALIYRQTTSPI